MLSPIHASILGKTELFLTKTQIVEIFLEMILETFIKSHFAINFDGLDLDFYFCSTMYIKLVGYRVFQQVLEKIQNLREIRIWKSYVKNICQIEVSSALLLRIFSPF